MNVRLQYDLEFLGSIWYEDTLQLNNYDVSLHLVTASQDQALISVAMDRVKYFVFETLANVVFINEKNQDAGELLKAIGINVCTLPEEPIDQIIGMMLYCKLNAIMNNIMFVSSLDISSMLGDNVWYQHDEEDLLGPFAKDSWWNLDSIQHDTLELDDTPENVVKVQTTGWHEVGLDWPDSTAPTQTKNIVVYPNFRKDENQ